MKKVTHYQFFMTGGKIAPKQGLITIQFEWYLHTKNIKIDN